MPKRQDAQRATAPLLLILFTALIFYLPSACQPRPNPEEQAPSPTADIRQTDLTQTSEPLRPPNQTPTSLPSPTPTTDCRAMGGETEKSSFFSEQLEKEFNFIIYLPPCYQESQTDGVPVLYLLHGLSYHNDQWLRLGLVDRMDALIAQGQIEPFIVILPEEAPSQPPQVSAFPEVLTQELIPWVDAHYKTQAEKPNRGIGGVSRGAAWAVQIGFEHPDLFCCIGAHSLPLFQADGGKINRWLNQAPAEELPKVFIDIGRNDQEWPSAKAFADQLDAAHVAHEWYLFTGGHSETYWTSHLDLYLKWYSQNW